MSRWPIRPLGEVCEVNPRLPRGHTIADDATVSFVPMAAVNEISGTIEGAEDRPYSEVRKGYTYFRDGDVLLAKITPCMENGKAAIARNLTGGHGFGSTEFHVLRARDEVLPEWIYYFVRQQKFRDEAKRNFTGTAGQQRVPTDFIRNTHLPVPPLDAQRRIVDILSRAEGIVRLRREAQRKAAELVPAIFIEMFGDPSTNPKGWPTKPLREVASVISGLAKGRVLASGEGVELPYMRVANVKDGFLDLAEVKSIKVKHSEIDKLLIERGDLLMTEGGDPDKLGRAALWDGEIARCVHQNHIFKVRSNRAHVRPTYLRSLVGSSYGKAYFLSVAKKTTGIASINKTQLSAFPVVLPPIADQAAFESRVAAVEAIVARQREAGSSETTMWDALLSRSFA